MATSYIGELRMFGGNFAPAGWHFCDGALLPISEYTALFQLIGTTYGGDGQSTFGLPNLQSRVPIHQGSGYVIGQMAGEENHTLTTNEIPSHSHQVAAATTATASGPSGNVYGGGGAAIYRNTTPGSAMNAAVIGIGGGGQPHANLMPYLCISFIISLFGVFPSRS